MVRRAVTHAVDDFLRNAVGVPVGLHECRRNRVDKDRLCHAAVSTTIVSNHAITLVQEEHHLGIVYRVLVSKLETAAPTHTDRSASCNRQARKFTLNEPSIVTLFAMRQ
jgi:hypothetical protein